MEYTTQERLKSLLMDFYNVQKLMEAYGKICIACI